MTTTRELIREVKLQVRLMLGMADLGYEHMPIYVLTGLRKVMIQAVKSVDDPEQAEELRRKLMLYVLRKLPFRFSERIRFNWSRGMPE